MKCWSRWITVVRVLGRQDFLKPHEYKDLLTFRLNLREFCLQEGRVFVEDPYLLS